MEGLGCQDGTGNGQVVLAGDQGRTTKVSRSTDAFEDGGEGDEGCNIGVREVVGAGRDRGLAVCLKSRSQDLNVDLFIIGDIFEVVVVLVTGQRECLRTKSMADIRLRHNQHRRSLEP